MKYTNKKRQIAQKFEITKDLAQNLFADCNKLYFNNTIPELPIEIITNDSVNGNFVYDINFDTNTTSNYKIQISNWRQRTKNAYISTIIHEIIHYLVISKLSKQTIKEAAWYEQNSNSEKVDELLYNGKYAHSNEWLKIASNINKIYGIKIHKE